MLQHQVSSDQTFSEQKMGTQPVHHITNLQTISTGNFRIWLSFHHNNIRHDHQQNSMAPEQLVEDSYVGYVEESESESL